MRHIQTIKDKEQKSIHRMGSCHPMRYGSHENVWSQFVPDDETMENRYKNKEAKNHVCFSR